MEQQLQTTVGGSVTECVGVITNNINIALNKNAYTQEGEKWTNGQKTR